MSDIFETTEYIVKGNPDTAETPPSPGGGFNPDSLSASTNTPVDADLIITKESNTWVKKTFSKVWDYIKSKIGINNSQGSANKFLNEKGTFTVVNSGKEYDLEFNNDLDEVTLTEDSVDKTTLPLVATYVGTRADWNNLSAAEQSQYRILHFTDEQVSVFSHIGQIIESTTLDTEAKVKAVYGVSTSWIQHTGYMLRGASSSVTANHTGNDGGADSVEVSSVASHNHSTSSDGAHAHIVPYSGTGGNGYASYKLAAGQESTVGIPSNGSAHNHTITNKGANYTVNTLPKYKNVYIWERVS